MKTKLVTGLLVLAAVLCILPMTVFAADTKTQCVCGGNAVGKPGHTCTSIEYQPWTSTTTLPSSGNYYLTGNVTTSGYRTLSNNLNLDLNGYNITRKLTNTATTQVFAVASNHSLSITDSTANPGTVSRDLSALTQAQRESINNWGLLIIVAMVCGTAIAIVLILKKKKDE